MHTDKKAGVRKMEEMNKGTTDIEGVDNSANNIEVLEQMEDDELNPADNKRTSKIR